MTRVRLEIECDAASAIARMEAMAARTLNFKPIFYYAQVELQKANAENFGAGGLPAANGPWAPRVRPAPWPLMIRTGKLMSSLTSLFGPPNNIGLTEAEFGTRVEYAKFHQYGTSKMPKRQIVFEPAGFSRDLASRAAKYVANGLMP